MLDLFSIGKEKLERKEFTVSGIYQLSSKNVYGGWYRYPLNMDPVELEYDMPGAFFCNAMDNLFQSGKVTMFMQTDMEEPNDLAYAITEAGEDGIDWKQIDIPAGVGGRRYAYSYILGERDFYSGILMPVFTALVILIVVLSMFGITRNVIQDKMKRLQSCVV